MKNHKPQSSAETDAAAPRRSSCTIRETRLHRGMRGTELAERLGVSAARVSVLERDEQRGAVTIRMMERAARALDCEFVYSLVPRQPAKRDRKRKVRLDCSYNVHSREQQLHDLARQLEAKQED